MISAVAYTLWLTLSTFIIGNAAKQAHEDEAKEEMKLFKEIPRKYRLGDIKEKK